jgi:AraC-like DNA-binding protein
MSKKRQTAILDPQGRRGAALTTLSHDFPDGHAIASHFHPEGQLVFACRGVMTVSSGDGIRVVPPLRAVWIPPFEPHAIRMFGAVRMRTLYFAPRLARRFARNGFVVNVSPLFRELILHACARTAWSARSAGGRRLVDFLAAELASAPRVPLQLPQPRDPRAARLVDHLLRDPGSAEPLGRLARRAGGSQRTLERLFLRETGLTLGKWRQQLRLQHAIQSLALGRSVTEAALDSGYRSPSAFIASFRKALGLTPRRYLGRLLAS